MAAGTNLAAIELNENIFHRFPPLRPVRIHNAGQDKAEGLPDQNFAVMVPIIAKGAPT